MDLSGFLPRVTDYLDHADLAAVPGWRPSEPFSVEPLAQGEYNMNYLLRQRDRAWVFRVNIGTQIGRALGTRRRFRSEARGDEGDAHRSLLPELVDLSRRRRVLNQLDETCCV